MLTSQICIMACREPGNQRNREILERHLETARTVGFAATFAASIFHYVGVGPTVRMRKRIICTKRKTRSANERRDTIVRYTAPERINHWITASASSWRR